MAPQDTGGKIIFLHPSPPTPQTTEIRKGVCQKCQHDLNDMLLEVDAGRMALPEFCPHCGRKISGTVFIACWSCAHCGEEITAGKEPDKKYLFCLQCGSSLIAGKERKVNEPKRG